MKDKACRRLSRRNPPQFEPVDCASLHPPYEGFFPSHRSNKRRVDGAAESTKQYAVALTIMEYIRPATLGLRSCHWPRCPLWQRIHVLISPWPNTTHFSEVSPSSPTGPRA